jgi:hypothetical protein
MEPEEYVDVREALEPEQGVTVVCKDLDPGGLFRLAHHAYRINGVTVSHS